MYPNNFNKPGLTSKIIIILISSKQLSILIVYPSAGVPPVYPSGSQGFPGHSSFPAHGFPGIPSFPSAPTYPSVPSVGINTGSCYPVPSGGCASFVPVQRHLTGDQFYPNGAAKLYLV